MSQNAEQVEAMLAAYVDGALEPGEIAQIEKHLASNPAHGQILEELKSLRNELTHLPRAGAPPEIYEAIQGHLERAVLLQGDDNSDRGGLRMHRWHRVLAFAAIFILALSLGLVIWQVLPHSNPQTASKDFPRSQPAGHIDLAAAGGGVAPLAKRLTEPEESTMPTQLVIRGTAGDVGDSEQKLLVMLNQKQIPFELVQDMRLSDDGVVKDKTEVADGDVAGAHPMTPAPAHGPADGALGGGGGGFGAGAGGGARPRMAVERHANNGEMAAQATSRPEFATKESEISGGDGASTREVVTKAAADVSVARAEIAPKPAQGQAMVIARNLTNQQLMDLTAALASQEGAHWTVLQSDEEDAKKAEVALEQNNAAEKIDQPAPRPTEASKFDKDMRDSIPAAAPAAPATQPQDALEHWATGNMPVILPTTQPIVSLDRVRTDCVILIEPAKAPSTAPADSTPGQ